MDNAKNINEQKKASKASNIIALAVCFVIAFLVWFYVMQTESSNAFEFCRGCLMNHLISMPHSSAHFV